jgi:hypothetical protein
MTGARPCECGAPSECSTVWYEALAAEQLDPAMGVWHTPLVCAFYLQHHSVYRPRVADGQYRFLRLFVDRGIEAVHVAARKSVARNRGSAPRVLPEELARYEGFPGRGFPAAFEPRRQTISPRPISREIFSRTRTGP